METSIGWAGEKVNEGIPGWIDLEFFTNLFHDNWQSVT